MMKKLGLLLIILFPFAAFASGDAARFDFITGAPGVVDNATSLCNNTATVYYGFTGTPAPIFDATATCTTSAPGITVFGQPVLSMRGQVFIRNVTSVR